MTPDESTRKLVLGAVRGDPTAVRAVVARVAPIVRVRIARALYRYRHQARRRNIEQETDDLTQEVFVALFENGARTLASWDPDRGLSLEGFVGLVADRTAGAVLRSGKRNPWRDDPVEESTLDVEADGASSLDLRVVSRDFAEQLFAELRASLSPLGFRMFTLLFLEQADVEDVCREVAMTPAAVYAWRSRLAKTTREIARAIDPESVPPDPPRAVAPSVRGATS